ncbi:hypothetical protein GCM10015535_02710 [Streptomyces gelaticus]|uniref:Uncharacterized protein n=1 Tax=Streptomyces gelaticus TaxID=285446 RepID=A0ABQ2VQD6_9ACTN|nr:hypothetical protein GCM10015535_02710 [Streptomyces gelaticus]
MDWTVRQSRGGRTHGANRSFRALVARGGSAIAGARRPAGAARITELSADAAVGRGREPEAAEADHAEVAPSA